MKKNLILSYKKYRKINHRIPYTFHIKNKGQHIFYFGSRHTYDIQDKQFKKIDIFWKSFLKKTSKEDCIVLVEGGVRKNSSTKNEAIRDGGEMQYVTYLARKEKIDVVSPEPVGYRYEELLKKFSRQEIAYYDFALICYQWNRMQEKPDFKRYASQFLEADKRNSGWDNFDFSLEHMQKIHKSIFLTTFDENDAKFLQEALDPISNKSVMNKISLAEEGLRDVYIAQEIERIWKLGKNIFVIYGSSHAVTQEAAIRDFVEKK